MGFVVGAARNRGGAADPRSRGARERDREYSDGTGRRQREARVWGAEQKKQKQNALSQTDTVARTSDPAQPNFFPTPD
jgi:hypothetical protein